jgi:hypothetical protein
VAACRARYPHGQVHDAGLGRLGLQPQARQQSGEPRKRGLGLLPGVAHDDRVVRITDQHTVLARLPCPVQPVQVDVTEQRRQRTALRRPGHAAPQRPGLQHPGPQNHADQGEDRLVADAFLDRLHQPVMRDRLETARDIGLHHPAAAPPGLIDEHLQGIVRRAPRPEPETARQEARLEDRLKHDLQRGLHDPVTDSRDVRFILRSFPGVARLGF